MNEPSGRKQERREPPVVAGRVPPNDLDAEAAVLAASLLDEYALDAVLELVEDSWYYSSAHQMISTAMRQLRESGKPVDIVTVAHELRERERYGMIGGGAYLGQLVDATPSVANVETYCEAIAQHAQRRRLIAECQTVSAEGYGDVGDHDGWIGDSERRIFEATQRRGRSEPRPIGELVVEEYRATQDEDRVETERIMTEISDYDHEVGGLWRGDLIVVAGRPGMGKTALASCWARNIALQRSVEGGLLYEVPMFSLEMPKRQVGQRFLAQESVVPLSKIRDRGKRHHFTDGEQRKLVDATARLDGVQIHVDDTPGITAMEIASRIRRADSAARKRGRRLGCAVVDYLQKVTVGRVGWKNRDEVIGAICNTLKNTAMELDLPVILLSQLNRGLESRTDKRPLLSDLRESGNIEQDADQVLFVYRDGYYSRKAEQKEAELIVAKNRMGATGVVRIGWWGWCTRFLNLEDA